MALKTREVTPRMAEANRQNAQKSTGPRTPEGKQNVAYNALRHAFYGKPCLPLMLALGEDPEEYREILAGLTQSFHPFTPAQHMLVEDMAMLRWELPGGGHRRRTGRPGHRPGGIAQPTRPREQRHEL